MPTLEELSVLVAFLYFAVLALFCFLCFLTCQIDKERERRKKQAFKAEVVEEVCAYFDQSRGNNN